MCSFCKSASNKDTDSILLQYGAASISKWFLSDNLTVEDGVTTFHPNVWSHSPSDNVLIPEN
jgi:hypothetical protein